MNNGNHQSAAESELSILKEIIRMLPTGVTVLDDAGDFLFVNDAADAQLGKASTLELSRRRETCLQALREGHPVVTEEYLDDGEARQVLLTTHLPVHLANRALLISTSADITDQKAFEEKLFHCAYYDPLTDLPLRRVIEHHANGLLRHDGTAEPFALASFDIDHFKHINDYYGPLTGDALLVEIARRLSRNLRESDMLARISGDEFLLLLCPIRNKQEVMEFIQSTLGRLSAPFFIDGSEIFVSASVGVSLHPEHGRSLSVLRQNADIAMNRVKNDGKGGAAFFDAGMEREVLARIRIEQSLRLALLEKRFCCAFQTKVDIRTKAVRGIEALVRLRDDRGVIQEPGSFVNLAIELGLIDKLTHMVLAEVVKSIDLINDAFGADTTISINVAAKQACNREFMRSLAQSLEDTGFPSRFMIEVTEDAFVAKSQFQTEILPMFRRLGVGISIDDFGTGYSSLSALTEITADEIKIDRSFITDIHRRPRSQGILRAIESLSGALGMTVIAEGVESFEELAYLQAATGIRYAQGYYFSRPIFLDELKPATRLISESRLTEASRPQQQTRPAYSRATRPAYSRSSSHRR